MMFNIPARSTHRTILIIDWARIAVLPFLALSAVSMVSACWSVADECWKLFS